MAYLRERAYRFYIADELYLHAHNQMHTLRLAEILEPPKEDDRTAEEIVADIVSRAGLEIVENELV